MQKKRLIVMISLLMAIVLLGIGTIAYFRRIVNGSLTGQTGNLVLIVNEANAVQNETFSVSLNRSTEEPYVMPGDSGTFNINIDSTGSSTDVDVTITMTRTNLPNNLKFYLDSSYTNELTTQIYTIKKAATMTKIVPVYWYWDGSKDDTNDTLFMGQSLEAVVNVSAVVASPATLKSVLAENSGSELKTLNGTESNENPILYYSGNATTNNVIFADKCWLIVRTTETGGTKIVYNGDINADGSCTASNANASIGASYYSEANNVDDWPNVTGVGYMYNSDNVEEYLQKITLEDTFYWEVNPTASFYDEEIDSETGRYVKNKYDSLIKKEIDLWFEENILNTKAEDLLEDTIWCNDRSGEYVYMVQYKFYSSDRVSNGSVDLQCAFLGDRFTVDRANGNGDLTYPIGLLTADEIMLTSRMLKGTFWTMTPAEYMGYYDGGIDTRVYDSELYKSSFSSDYDIRPAVSLIPNVLISDGDGSFETPYIIS